MVSTRQTTGQAQDGGASQDVVTRPWTPRPQDGARAVLVSERNAQFLRQSTDVVIDDHVEQFGSLGPVPAGWTWDLVHCRLLAVHALIERLPGPRVPALYRSFLTNLQPHDAGKLRKPLSVEEHALVDWTWDRLFCWSEIDRAVLMGIMAGKSLSMVSKITFAVAAHHGGNPIRKTAVHKRYRRNTTTFAEEWNALGVAIDKHTRECWLNKSSRKS